MKIIALLWMPCALLGEDMLLAQAAEKLVHVGQCLHEKNLCPATSGNFSTRLTEDRIAITVSGKHKGELTSEDVIVINRQGESQESLQKPSAETAIHLVIYRFFPGVQAVIHTHSANGTVLSRLIAPDSAIVTEGYEIHKAFRGISTHESMLVLPIFENTQDYDALSGELESYLREHPQTYGIFLRGHGLYTWGTDLNEAKIRTEAFEFLFECELKTRAVRG